ncbi:MAG: autotransporter outer membrane beta-barrel domain-containing protein [Proteobacteria bacterium]|nr:autotransporter outer membrane beta-barrel domain-containing protein [Pseudomonadota bacterium]
MAYRPFSRAVLSFIVFLACSPGISRAESPSEKSLEVERISNETLSFLQDKSHASPGFVPLSMPASVPVIAVAPAPVAAPALAPDTVEEMPPQNDIVLHPRDSMPESDWPQGYSAVRVNKTEAKNEPRALFPKHTLELGPEVLYRSYKEPGLMKQWGTMYELDGSYTYHNSVMLRAEGRFGLGQVDYSSNGTGSLHGITDRDSEFRGLIGYDFPTRSSWDSSTDALTPYIGLGYRHLIDDMEGKVTTTGNLGYKRESRYLYSPIGVEDTVKLKSGWTMGMTAEYDAFWGGKQLSTSNGFDFGLGTGFYALRNVQNTGYGLRGSIQFMKKEPTVNLVIEPFIRYWNIRASDIAQITYNGAPTGVFGFEPNNNTTEIGLKFAARY